MSNPTQKHLYPEWKDSVVRIKSFYDVCNPEDYDLFFNFEKSLSQIFIHFKITSDQFWRFIDAGFFFHPTFRIVMCYSCGTSFSHLQYCKFPIIDHILASHQYCTFLLENKKTIIEKVLKEFSENDMEEAVPRGHCFCNPKIVNKYVPVCKSLFDYFISIPEFLVTEF